MNEVLDIVFISGLIGATMRMATPIIFATLGEILSERAGVLNLGIEGIIQLLLHSPQVFITLVLFIRV